MYCIFILRDHAHRFLPKNSTRNQTAPSPPPAEWKAEVIKRRSRILALDSMEYVKSEAEAEDSGWGIYRSLGFGKRKEDAKGQHEVDPDREWTSTFNASSPLFTHAFMIAVTRHRTR